MKILFCNKYFYPRGGAEISMFETARLLEKQGHRVAFFSMVHPLNLPSDYSRFFVSPVEYDGRQGAIRKIKSAGRILYSLEAKRKIRELIRQEKPDIVHLNNIYHQISPSIIDELHHHSIPMVMTTRDYKLVCPTYNRLREGVECELCSGSRYYQCFLKRCTKGSFAMSLVNALEMYLHHRIMQIYNKIAICISPSVFLKNKIEEMGFKGRIICLPNFVTVSDFEPAFSSENNSIVYFGRLSREKGLATLIEAVKGVQVRLKVIGDGPQRGELERQVVSAGLDNVRFLGYLQGEPLHREIKKSRFVVVPSEWPEIFGRVVIEGYALGKPVLGARIGAIPELVQDFETGLTFEPGNVEDLREKIGYLTAHPDLAIKMGKQGRKLVEKGFNPDKHYEILMGIYQMARNSV